jgi:hypothetical protein
MNRVDTGDPNRLEYREPPVSWGVLLLLYLILSLAGFGLAAGGAIFAERWSSQAELFQTLGLIAIMSFGGVPFLVFPIGLYSMMTCLTVRIDRRARTVERRWGSLVPVGLSAASLDRYQELRLCREPVRGERKYRLYLTNGANERLLIGRAGVPAAMRPMADDLGAFLGWKVDNAI